MQGFLNFQNEWKSIRFSLRDHFGLGSKNKKNPGYNTPRVFCINRSSRTSIYKMAANIEQLINSPAGLRTATLISQAIPPGLGYRVANLAARWITSRRDIGPVKAVRANQKMIAGEQGTSQELDQDVEAVFRYSARSIYDLYHVSNHLELASQMYVIDPSFQPYFYRHEFDRRGLIIAGLHMTGFDLGLQWLCFSGFKPLVLTLPDPEGGRQVEFETRRKTGMNLVPTSFIGLRQAFHHLQRGGVVLTGVDRPVPAPELRPRFFGHPSDLPLHYVSLALKVGAPIVVIASRLEKDGKYHIHASQPINPSLSPDRVGNLLSTTEAVLAVAEDFIRQTPQQWLISLPVWPDIIDGAPGSAF